MAPKGVLNAAITPVSYQKFVDINDNSQLNRFGLHNGAPYDSNRAGRKMGIALLSFPPSTRRTRMIISWSLATDNDFITQDGHTQGQPYSDTSGINNDTLMLVYRVTLPTYVAPIKGGASAAE